MLTARYRRDYEGEFVVTKTSWSGGLKTQQRAWIPNQITNHHASPRAACIGSDVDRDQFDFTRLQRHRGGLLGSLKLQTYGTGHIALQMPLDFAAETNEQTLQQLVDQKYHENHIVYTSPRRCLNHPGMFYPVPYGPVLIPQVLAVYLAAFDDHREIFLLGYHRDAPAGSQAFMQQMQQVFDAYTDTVFTAVGRKTQVPEAWLEQNNLRHMTYREFFSYCDV
jgi:hypothetical protein